MNQICFRADFSLFLVSSAQFSRVELNLQQSEPPAASNPTSIRFNEQFTIGLEHVMHSSSSAFCLRSLWRFFLIIRHGKQRENNFLDRGYPAEFQRMCTDSLFFPCSSRQRSTVFNLIFSSPPRPLRVCLALLIFFSGN
jgi:hypothetical protein